MPNIVLLEQALKLNFKASNNQAEYKELIAGLKLAKEAGDKKIRCYTHLQLVQGQVANKYQTKEIVLLKYYYHTLILSGDYYSLIFWSLLVDL